MKRAQFFKTILSGVAAICVAPIVFAESESKPAFNIKRLQGRLDFLKKHPITPDECFPQKVDGVEVVKGDRFIISTDPIEGGSTVCFDRVDFRWRIIK